MDQREPDGGHGGEEASARLVVPRDELVEDDEGHRRERALAREERERQEHGGAHGARATAGLTVRYVKEERSHRERAADALTLPPFVVGAVAAVYVVRSGVPDEGEDSTQGH